MSLNSEQQTIFDIVKSGASVFISGEGGSGKSHLLRYIIDNLDDRKLVTTASTGVAAYNVQGSTLHSYSGLGLAKNRDKCIKRVISSGALRNRWFIDSIIIDEISMLDIDYFVLISDICRIVREEDKPFGGIQIILCGDFLQLPPIGVSSDGYKFLFQHPIWKQMNLNVCLLRSNMRQKDEYLYPILTDLRYGVVSDQVIEFLKLCKKTKFPEDGILPTVLFPTNKEVDTYNSMMLDKLDDLGMPFNMLIEHDPKVLNDDQQLILKSHKEEIPDYVKSITLKIGAQIIITRNNKNKGVYNGMKGVVVAFKRIEGSDIPIIKVENGMVFACTTYERSYKIAGGIRIKIKQLPLRLGWATSIHKSQGMTLSRVSCDLASVFENGQVYVVLSRIKDRDSIHVTSFSKSKIRSHPEAVKFYQDLLLDNI